MYPISKKKISVIILSLPLNPWISLRIHAFVAILMAQRKYQMEEGNFLRSFPYIPCSLRLLLSYFIIKNPRSKRGR